MKPETMKSPQPQEEEEAMERQRIIYYANLVIEYIKANVPSDYVEPVLGSIYGAYLSSFYDKEKMKEILREFTEAVTRRADRKGEGQ